MVVMNTYLEKKKAEDQSECPVFIDITDFQTENSFKLSDAALNEFIQYASNEMPESKYLHIEMNYDELEGNIYCNGYAFLSSDLLVVATDETLWSKSSPIHVNTYDFITRTMLPMPETVSREYFQEQYLIDFSHFECLRMKKG